MDRSNKACYVILRGRYTRQARLFLLIRCQYMGLIFWKHNKRIDAFALAVADDLYSHVQPEVARVHLENPAKHSKKKRYKIEQKFKSVVAQMRKFSEDNSLGIYGKARLQKQFNERLHELGYDTAVTNRLVEIILLGNN